MSEEAEIELLREILLKCRLLPRDEAGIKILKILEDYFGETAQYDSYTPRTAITMLAMPYIEMMAEGFAKQIIINREIGVRDFNIEEIGETFGNIFVTNCNILIENMILTDEGRKNLYNDINKKRKTANEQ